MPTPPTTERLRLRPGDAVALTACSNGLTQAFAADVDGLVRYLASRGLTVRASRYLDARGGDTIWSWHGGRGGERAAELVDFVRDPDVRAIFDVSGGDLANGVLGYLDFAEIRRHPTAFVGYSDLTVLTSAINVATGQPTWWWSALNLVGPQADLQQGWFEDSVLGDGDALFRLEPHFLHGDAMRGQLVGGNIRCLLKLAGTPHWPAMAGNVLALEAWRPGPRELWTLFNQLALMGVFSQISGLLLGHFTYLDEGWGTDAVLEIVDEVLRQVPGAECLPVARTWDFGHSSDSRCLRIGQPLDLARG